MSGDFGPVGPELWRYNNNCHQNGGFIGRHDLRPQLQQVESPCDIKSPLARGSNWPYEVILFPASARPAYGVTFNLYQEVIVPVTGEWVTVVEIDLQAAEEGRVLKWAGEEEGASGSDLFWRIAVQGSTPARYDVMRGGWSTIALPQEIITPIPTGKIVALQVFLPAAGPSPRTVRGLIRGWTAPFDGGGTFSGGFARS